MSNFLAPITSLFRFSPWKWVSSFIGFAVSPLPLRSLFSPLEQWNPPLGEQKMCLGIRKRKGMDYYHVQACKERGGEETIVQEGPLCKANRAIGIKG